MAGVDSVIEEAFVTDKEIASVNEIDVLIYFRDSRAQDMEHALDDDSLIRACDLNNVPLATNVGTAEVIVTALDRGDIDWREFVNPNSEYNRKHS